MTKDIKKVVLITGASRGIGNAVAKEFAKDESNIVIGTATTEERALQLTNNMKEEGFNNIHGIAMNIADNESVTNAIKAITNDLGSPDVLINNAGATSDNLFLLMKEEQWESIIDTNLNGVYRVVKACIKPMIKSRWGRIINLSSVVGFTGNPGQCNYSAAKAGVVAMTKSLAAEVATRGITVNAIAPGFIETDMTGKLNEQQKESILSSIPMGKMGSPSDIANAAKFLASDCASYITGETVHVNGGMFMG